MSLIGKGLKIQNTLKNTARLSEILSVLASFGFTPWIKKLKLTKFITPLGKHPELLNSSMPERLRIAFEHLGPTFIKFGQILATRPDLLPLNYIESLEKLQDQVKPLPFGDLKKILSQELGDKLVTRIKTIEEYPLGSASIAQVHRASLVTGESVVLKIQKPDVVTKIREDLRILIFLSHLVHDNIPEFQSFGIPELVLEFAEGLSKETEFYLEANNIRKFQLLFSPQTGDETPGHTDSKKDPLDSPSEDPLDDPSKASSKGSSETSSEESLHTSLHVSLKVPQVYWDLTTDRVLVLEELKGLPLSQPQALKTKGLNPQELSQALLENYLEQVFIHGFFHGDLHPGNVLILENNRFGLIDFGMMGRLSHKTKVATAKILHCLATEDYESLAIEYIHLSPFDEKIIVERFASGLSQVLSPYYGLNLNNVNVGDLLLKTAHLASKEGLHIPRELLILFRSLVGIESIIRKLDSNFDFLTGILKFANETRTQELSWTEWKKSVEFLAKDSEHLIKDFPKQIHFLLKKWTSPYFELKLGGTELKQLNEQLRHLSFSLFWGLISLGLILSLSLFVIFDKHNPHNWVLSILLLLGFIITLHQLKTK
jgi:ubiquinone biosynthesis protein